MVSEPEESDKNLNATPFGLKEILTVFHMAMEEDPRESASSIPSQVFGELSSLIDQTVHGTKLKQLSPRKKSRLFHTLEIQSEGGEVLGYLNMIYFKKPITSYYLVYVEVLPPFRGRGLGHQILNSFKEFAETSRAIGLLDNIILPEDPTYTLYTKLGWKPIEELIGHGGVDQKGHYMVYIPESILLPNLKEKLVRFLFNVKKKRPVIDMQDNEAMVIRTIEEFRSVYEVLKQLFDKELSNRTLTPFMCYMFTKFVTKVLGFHRRISKLIGYTGGESLDQISISDQIKDLPILPYSLSSPQECQVEIWEDEKMIRAFPERLFKEPTFFIEDLPLYRRPYLFSWMEKKGVDSFLRMKISDLIELGFDPTKLREFHHENKDFIFERISPGHLQPIKKLRTLLEKISDHCSNINFRDTTISINPPLAVFRDRGNGYILRRKVGGIHLDEALDQLRTSPHLKEMNQAIGIDRALLSTINEVNKRLLKTVSLNVSREMDDLTFFVPWDLEKNIPKVMVHVSDVSFENLWIA